MEIEQFYEIGQLFHDEGPYYKKPVHRFAEQINRLVST